MLKGEIYICEQSEPKKKKRPKLSNVKKYATKLKFLNYFDTIYKKIRNKKHFNSRGYWILNLDIEEEEYRSLSFYCCISCGVLINFK